MSGGLGPYSVGGIQVTLVSPNPLPNDDVICSVFHQMAEFVNDPYVREALQREISQGGALYLPPVSVCSLNVPESTRAATIAGGPLQVTIPFSNGDLYSPDLAVDTRDLSICIAILTEAWLIGDAVLRASTQNGAKAGLKRMAQVLAEHLSDYQALGISPEVKDGSIQVSWNNLPSTTQVQLERREVDQRSAQLIALLDGSSSFFTDIAVGSSKSYVYDIKNLKDNDLVAVGYSNPVYLVPSDENGTQGQ